CGPLVLNMSTGGSKRSKAPSILGTIDDGGLGLTGDHRDLIRKQANVVHALHQRTEQTGPCQLDVMLVYELYENQTMASLLYPVNVMRNLARLMARTPIMGAIDVDMMVGGELADELATNATAAVDLVRRVMGNTTRGREAAERAERGTVAVTALYAAVPAERSKVRADRAAAEARAAAAVERARELFSAQAVGPAPGPLERAAPSSVGLITSRRESTSARRLLRGVPGLQKLGGRRRRRTTEEQLDGEGYGDDEGEDGREGSEELGEVQDGEDEAAAGVPAASGAALEPALTSTGSVADSPPTTSASPDAAAATSTGSSPSAPSFPANGRVAVVLPAFTTDWRLRSDLNAPTLLAEGLALRPTNKTLLREWFNAWHFWRFAPKRKAHLSTDTEKWLETDEWYEVKANDNAMYEPWVLVDRLTSPWHDIRFRGYGMNKVMHLYHLNGLGYQLQVHPRAYLVHRPHRQTKARMKHNSEQSDQGLRGRANSLSAAVREAVDSGSYEPWIDSMTEACRRILPWWREGPWAEAPQRPAPSTWR
ncbi:hypothetical protein HYH03_009545, partial [Edaphochlamys debaryana]